MNIKINRYKYLTINRTGKPNNRFWDNYWTVSLLKKILGFYVIINEWDVSNGN